MLQRWAVVAALLAMPLTVDDAAANGRPPGTSTITFKRGDDQQIAVGMTFGLLMSSDGGATWHWVCEDAVGYGGMYDPDYAFAADGALYATTFDGVVATRDGGCTFVGTSLGTKFSSALALGPTGNLHVAMADDRDGKVYTSLDGGMTFPRQPMPGMLKDWWASIEVAPSDPDRIYLSGYRLVPGQPKVHLLFKSSDGGASFEALPPTSIDDFAVMPNSSIEIVGVSPTNPDVVFARVELADNSISDAIYRSDDGGTSWTLLVEKRDSIAFLVRKNGDLVLATEQVDPANGLGAFVSTNNGASWTPLPGPPHISCLAENAAGEVWACTQNYGMPGVPSDEFGIMKTSGDLATWSGVLQYQAITAPLACASGTTQKDTCDDKLWCGLCMQLGCDPKRSCPTGMEVDGPPGDGPLPMPPPPKDSCCGASHGGSSLALAAIVGMLLGRRRRSCCRASTGSRTARSTFRC